MLVSACGSGGTEDEPTVTVQPTSVATSTPQPTEPPTPVPTLAPDPTSPPAVSGDRTDCNAIRGTAYRSEAERGFFLGNCTSNVVAPPATAVPATGDRSDCNAIRGTAYRSEAERKFFLANCTTSQPGTPPVAIDPLISPAGGATALGDSVMLGAAPYLQSVIGGIYVDATVSRQASTGAATLQPRAQAGQLGSVVIVHLGNNGTFTQAEFDGIMALLANVPRVVVVNISVPRSWEASNNAMLSANVGRYPNARLVDWHTAALNRPDYFWEDRVHLRPEGAATYAAMIAYASVA